jgi:hypothetical protein
MSILLIILRGHSHTASHAGHRGSLPNLGHVLSHIVGISKSECIVATAANIDTGNRGAPEGSPLQTFNSGAVKTRNSGSADQCEFSAEVRDAAWATLIRSVIR